MPREVIYADGLPYGTPEEPGPARTIVELTWQKGERGDGNVEVVTRCVRAVDTSVVYEARPGEPGADEDLAGQHIPRTFGVYAGLDRRGINKLISDLRTARNQVFGKDE